MIMVRSLTFGTPSGDFLSRKVGWVVLAVLGLGLLVLAGCQAKRSPAPDNAAPATKGISVNRITYVSPDANLFTIKPDGSDIKKLTGGLQARSLGGRMAQRLDFRNIYAWPTWSPDGGKLAASRVQIGGERAEVSVEVIDTATGRARTIFRNDPSVASLVAQTAPHYLYWAPDGHSLAFVAPTPQGLTLFVSNTEDASDPTVVQIGSPIYFHWAKDGSSMLLHTAREVRLAQRPFTSAFTELTDEAVGFRAPALSSDGTLMAYTVPSSSGSSLVIAGAAKAPAARELLDLAPISAFMWSPTGKELAVVDQVAGSAFFQRLQVVTSDGSNIRTIAEEPMVAFYWSPNGEHIAWVSLDRESQVFTWKVAGGAGGPARELFRFQPSTETLDMLSFFDQFAYSHSPWSPDSSSLVVAGTAQSKFQRRNGETPTGDRVFILDATGLAAAREIAAGTLAFWSWN